jgi:hypothetical protein
VSLDKRFGAEVLGERVNFDLTRIAEIPALIASMGEIDTQQRRRAALRSH